MISYNVPAYRLRSLSLPAAAVLLATVIAAYPANAQSNARDARAIALVGRLAVEGYSLIQNALVINDLAPNTIPAQK
jgi:phosphoribosylaminoimidazole carboxylase (NCAIR synthetase)